MLDPLHWRHNDHDGVSNHQPNDCLLNRLFGRRPKKPSKLRVTGLCAGNSPHKGPVTRKMFPFDDVIMGAESSTTLWCLLFGWRRDIESSFAVPALCAEIQRSWAFSWMIILIYVRFCIVSTFGNMTASILEGEIYGDITWAPWRLKSLVNGLFVQQLFEATTGGTLLTYWSSVGGECSDDWWILFTKGSVSWRHHTTAIERTKTKPCVYVMVRTPSQSTSCQLVPEPTRVLCLRGFFLSYQCQISNICNSVYLCVQTEF